MREREIKLSDKKINKIVNSLMNVLYLDDGYYDVKSGLLSDQVTWKKTTEKYVEEFMEEHYFFLRLYKIEQDSLDKLLDTFEKRLCKSRPMENPDYSEYNRFWGRGLGSSHNLY